MVLGARIGMWQKAVGGGTPTFLNWLQSDGSTGYVDTGFVVEDSYTRYIIEGALLSGFSRSTPLVGAGAETAFDGFDVSAPMFVFGAIFNDRQAYFRSGYCRFWNSANAVKWNDGAIHQIDIGAISATTCTVIVDGTSKTMRKDGSWSIGDLPTDSQVIFGSKRDGSYYLVNNVYKVRRVAYSLDGDLLADFRAADVGGEYGFYDLVSSTFHPATGTLISGGELTA